VILVWLCQRIPGSRRFAAAGLLLLGLAGVSYVVQRQIIDKQYLDMPAGRAAFLAPEVWERYNWIRQNTKEGDVFFEAQHPSFYFPFHLKNPTPMSIMRDSEYTPRFQVDATVAALERQPPKIVVWNGNWSKSPESRAAGDNLEPLWQFIRSNYDLEVKYAMTGNYTLSSSQEIEIWRRKGAGR
jgi:hypothetical protein